MAKFKVGDKVKSAGARDTYVVKRVMRVGDFSFDPNLKEEAEKAYAKGDVGYEVHDEDDADEVTYLFEKDDRLTLANSARNAKDGFGAEINVGDMVKFLTGTWRGLEGKVLKIDGSRATVRTKEQGDVVEDLSIIRVYNSRHIASTNAVVQNALNARAVRNGYVVLRTASGGTAKVYEGDRVSYAGKEYVAKALGSPQMDKATLVDGSGNKLIVRLKDVDLKALNARTARNADGDGAAVKAIRDLQRRIAPLAREAEAMRGKFIANKWYGYDAALEFIAKRLKEAEAEGKW